MPGRLEIWIFYWFLVPQNRVGGFLSSLIVCAKLLHQRSGELLINWTVIRSISFPPAGLLPKSMFQANFQLSLRRMKRKIVKSGRAWGEFLIASHPDSIKPPVCTLKFNFQTNHGSRVVESFLKTAQVRSSQNMRYHFRLIKFNIPARRLNYS